MRDGGAGGLADAMSPSTRSTYSMIVSSLALVVALGGTGAYAAEKLAKNSVTTKQIKNGTIQAEDVKDAALTGAQVAERSLTGADLAAETVTGAQVADRSLVGADLAGDTVTGAQVNESTLGKVPSAAAVDTVQHFSVTPKPNGETMLVTTKGPLTLSARCQGIVGVEDAWLMLATSANGTSIDTDSTHLTNRGPADGDIIVLSDPVGGGYVLDSVVAAAPDGTSLYVLATLQGGSAGCHLDVVVLG
jgi:hypothetical protein